MVDLDGQKHKALVDTGSNVSILSKKTYSQYEHRSKLRPFRKQVLSATNDHFEILGVFTAELTFGTGISVKADRLVTGESIHRCNFDTWNSGDRGEQGINRLPL